MPFSCDSMEKREKKAKWATKAGNLGAGERVGRAREKEKERLQDGIVFSVFHAQILNVKIVIGQN